MEAKDLAPIQPIILEDDGNLLLLVGANGVAGSAFHGVFEIDVEQGAERCGKVRVVAGNFHGVSNEIRSFCSEWFA